MKDNGASQPDEDKLRDFCDYAESVTERAADAFLERRPSPSTAAEKALHEAYANGLKYSTTLTLVDGKQEATGLGISLCEELEENKAFDVIGGQFSPTDYMDALYRDDRGLVDLWQAYTDTAENIAFWQGMNDVQEFAVCFMRHSAYQDDFRGIRDAVTGSVEKYGVTGIWNKASNITYSLFDAPTALGLSPRPDDPFVLKL